MSLDEAPQNNWGISCAKSSLPQVLPVVHNRRNMGRWLEFIVV